MGSRGYYSTEAGSRAAFDALGAALKASAINELSLSGNKIRGKDIQGFCQDIPDMGALSKLKMDRYELPVQEIKTATELDLSNKGLGKLDAIVIAVLIKVCKLQNRFVTNQIAYRPFHAGQWVVGQVGFE
jgi:hypothetical protein